MVLERTILISEYSDISFKVLDKRELSSTLGRVFRGPKQYN